MKFQPLRTSSVGDDPDVKFSLGLERFTPERFTPFSLCLVPPDEIEQMDRHSVKIMRFSLCISVDSGAMFGHIFPTKQRVLAAGMRKPHR